jgi:hypothetical protein
MRAKREKGRTMIGVKRLMTAALVPVAAALTLLPAAASATVYCTDNTTGTLSDNFSIDSSCKVATMTIPLALESAQKSAEPDSVLIGPGNYTLPAGVGPSYYELYYNSFNDNTIQIRGAGVDATRLTMGSTTGVQKGIRITAPTGSSISDLRVTIPSNSDANSDIGIEMEGGVDVHHLLVDGPTASNAVGVHLGGGRLDRVRVDLPIAGPSAGNTAVASFYQSATIADSFLHAGTGVQSSGVTMTIERTTLATKWGTKTDSGSLVFRDSVVDLGNHEFAVGVKVGNDNNGTNPIGATLDGLTVVGGGPESAGIIVQADSGTETAKARISNTIVEGPSKPLQVLADNGRPAEVVASYSNYGTPEVNNNLDGTGATGTASYTPVSITSLAPGFVNPAAGDFHLASGSPLIDAGSPEPPPADRLDIDGGARAASSQCPNAPGRRDIGADEFEPSCAAAVATPSLPDTTIRGRKRIATAKKRAKVVFRLSSSEPGASFRCSVDGKPFKSCGSVFAVSLKRGRHTIRAKAVGVAGADPTPAIAKVRVVKKQPTEARRKNR